MTEENNQQGNQNNNQQEPNQQQGNAQQQNQQQKSETFELKVNGENKVVTLEEMKTMAQKAAGAESKFEEASKLHKEAQDGLRFKELIGRLSDDKHKPSDTEIRELAGIIGVDPEEFAQYLQPGDHPQGGKKGVEGLSKEQFSQMFEEMFGFAPAEAKARLDYSHTRHVEAAKEKIFTECGNAVDKDEIFGKMIVGKDKDARLSVVKDMVAEDVLRRIQDGQPYGAELVTASVQKIRAYLTKFGIPGKPEQYPISLGLGPGQGLPSEVQSDKPIARVKSTEQEAEDNFIKRAMQKGLQMIRNNPNNS